MKKEAGLAQTPEQVLLAREVFEIGREVALKGIPAGPCEHWGNQEKTTYLGTYRGRKYAIAYSVFHNGDGRDLHGLKIMGRDLSVIVTTETPEGTLEAQGYKMVTDFNDANIDPKDLIVNLRPVADFPEAPIRQILRDKVFRLDTNEGPGSLLIKAESEQEAAEKYLDWCEANNYFDAIVQFRTSFHHFAASSVIS
jgi:hypothetical protein